MLQLLLFHLSELEVPAMGKYVMDETPRWLSNRHTNPTNTHRGRERERERERERGQMTDREWARRASSMDPCKNRPCVLTLFCHLFLTICNSHTNISLLEKTNLPSFGLLLLPPELFHYIKTLPWFGVWRNEDVLPLYRMKKGRIHGHWNKCEFNFYWPSLIF